MGRGAELRALVEALPSGPAVVFVEGEAGVGKSRLVGEATDRLIKDGIPVLTGWCHPLREPLPFGPVIDALRSAHPHIPHDVKLSLVVWALHPFLPALADRFPDPAPGPEVQEGGRQQLMRAVHEVLSALGPVVLVVEDMHWADEATRELLLFLARNPPQELRLVVTYRAQDLADDAGVFGSPYRRPVGVGGTEISLSPLPEAQIRELAVSVLGQSAAAALGRQLFERCGGLPLVAEEDLLVLAEGLGKSAGTALGRLKGAGVPRALQEAVQARVGGLDPVAVAVVQAAAVLAVPASEQLLGALAKLSEDEAEEGLTAALEASVLVETAPGLYGFRHVLARQSVYERIVGPRRRRLHMRAVEALETQVPPALVQIAHHTRQLGDVQAWLPRAQAAAVHAVEVGDDGIAEDLLQQLLAESTLPPQERTRAALTLSRIAHYSVDYASSADALRRIMDDPHLSVETRGEIRLALGLFMINQCQDKGGFRELERAVEELTHRPALAVRAMVALACGEPHVSARMAQAWMQRAERTVIEASELWAHAAVWATRLNLMALDGEDEVWWLLDLLPRQVDDREVLRHYLRALTNCGVAAMERGYDERAADLLRESRELCKHSGFSTMEYFSQLGLLVLDWLAGRWTGLEDHLAALGNEAPEMIPVTKTAAQIGGNLAAARGQWARALREFGRAAVMEDQYSEAGEVLCGIAGIAQVRLAQGDPEAAWATVRPALDPVPTAPRPWADGLLTVAVRAALACGHREIAGSLLSSVEERIHNKDSPTVDAVLHLTHGLILQDDGELDAAAAHFDQAHLIWDATGRPYHSVQAAEFYARTRVPTAPQEAARQLTRLADAYTDLGATADAARCQQTLRELGLTRPSPSGGRRYGRTLSPRESQVASLLADGATNQDIAQALSLSPRTVEHHVAHALQKLRVTRRALQEGDVSLPVEDP
ncbi:ATP-binding protein [Streptomyces sp. NBC_00829]|uniref:ATP-binding protein n=1 Tax=Streptomyces sp. NBC_00829 TaxID=2903679 RepID=UPI0038660987|nr:AAA family ATPase [Streptomyces sp. NBC_00829]